MTNYSGTGNNEEAVDFLRRWGEPYILTCIDPDKKNIQTQQLKLSELRPWLETWNGKRNIYFQVNPSLRFMSRKASREDISEVRWLHVDVDPRVGEDIKEEQHRAYNLLVNAEVAPNVIVFSGGGYQGFWKLDEPIPIGGDLAAAEEAARYNIGLENLFTADNCHNIDRIMRLPGTVNIPDAKKTAKGRTRQLAKLIKFTEDTFSLERFIPAPKVQVVGGTNAGTVQVSGNVERLSSVEELENVPDWCKATIVQGSHPDDPEKYGSRSEALFAVCCEMVRSECSDDTIFAVITDPDFLISSSVIDKGSNIEQYAKRQIERARENAIDPWLRVLNEKHAVVGNIGGKCRIIEEVEDSILSRTKLTLQNFADFKNRYSHQKIQVGVTKNGPVLKSVGNWWLDHPNRRQYETIVFHPGKTAENGAYNLWKGFGMEALPGNKHETFLEHLRHNVCGGSTTYYDYLIGLLARCIKDPATPGQVAVVMRGRQGVGKSFFVKHFGELFGRHYLQVTDPKHLVGSFNAHLRDCVVLFGDEAFYAGDKKHESILKGLITEELLAIEAKGVDVVAAPNFVHLFLSSNSEWVIPAGMDERRYFVLDVGDDVIQDSAYFGQMAKELNEGGYSNLLWYLLNYDLTDFEIRKVPKTGALQEQKLLNMTHESAWWYHKLCEGRVLVDHDQWEKATMKEEVWDDYIEWARNSGVYKRLSKMTLGKFMKRVAQADSIQKAAQVKVFDKDGWERYVDRRPYFFVVPELKECRDIWERQTGMKGDW